MIQNYDKKLKDYKEKEGGIYLNAKIIDSGTIREAENKSGGTFKAQNLELKDKDGIVFELQCTEGNCGIVTQAELGKQLLIKGVYWKKTYENKPILTTGFYKEAYGPKIQLGE